MSRINELEIKITKAIITKVEIELGSKGKPELTVYGQLLTDKGKKISTFMYGSNAWETDNEIEFPLSLHLPAKEIFEKLTPIIYDKINGKFTMIEEEKAEDGIVIEESEDFEF
jgi:hypothetical protein